MRPAHKRMDTTKFANDLGSRSEIEVVVVGQNYLGANIFQVLGGKRLDRCSGANRHKYRCGNVAVRGVNDSSSTVSRNFLA